MVRVRPKVAHSRAQEEDRMNSRENNGTVSRRSFCKSAAASGVGIAALGLLGGCSPAQGKTQSSGKPSSENGAVDLAGVEHPAQITGDGRYVTKALGHEGYIHVATELWEGKITACKVISQHETIGIGTYACARIPAAIVEHQSVNVPNVRGCSMTSIAIKGAVKEAIAQSGYDIEQFSAEIAEPDVNKDETIDVDVAVVGGGTAGLVCAAKLADTGYNVAVLEKHAIPGGSGTMTYSGIMASGTRQVKAYNFDGSVPEKFVDQEANLKSLAAISDPETDRYNGVGPFARTAYPALTEAVDWMVDCGIGFMPMGMFEGTYSAGYTNVLSPGMYMGGAGFQAMVLAQRLERGENSRVFYMTKATELIQDESGKVVGVKAVGLKSDDSENGHNLTVNAKAVVLTTGSYALNPELLKEYEPEFAGQSFHCCSASTGDGVVMGLAAGSKVECTGIQFPAYPATASYFEIAFIDSHAPCVMVNNTGGYIGTDDLSHAGMSRALMDESNGGRFFFVLDASSEPTLRYSPSMGYSTYQALYERGELYYYDTVEAAAEDLDLPDLVEFLAENNRAALAGEASSFGAEECPYLETGSGIYLIPTMPAHYLTPSGICIDPQQHVLTDSYVMDGDNTVIEGLYAAGDVSGTISVREGRGYYNGYPLAIGCGYLAAQTIDAEIADL